SGARADELASIFDSDQVDVVTSDVATATRAAPLEPSLIVIEDTGETTRIAEICRRLRRKALRGYDIPVILITHSDNQARDRALGISDRLIEPFSMSYARTRLRAWLMRTACRWSPAGLPSDEMERLAALHRLGLLDTPPEDRFDRLTERAAKAL